ncbi:hypothetical protein SAMN04488483_5343 [Pseudomonas helmanticensis]|uniref:Uncharacterized protein n=1 Tax=Pseudomonas helmanticensis TaxID=1471381 RepID=A0ACD2UDC1_9PSED|nr:hypothetical protein [Pseudomonas helmanticensis]SMQ30299.1 hypothetical protein SAMN04488483_5343 [Pseudomonas helmanticensis]
MTVFSCRAECQDDVDTFIEAAKAAKLEMVVRAFADKVFPDVEIEIISNASKDELRVLMQSVEDGHMMRQTLRAIPLSENSMEPDDRVE